MELQLSYFKILKDDAVKVLHSICQQIWKTQQWPQDWKRSIFIPVPKKGNAKECSNYHTNALISHASKVMLKILQARLQQYVNRELPDVQAGFRKAEEPEIKLPTCTGSLKKQESSRKIPTSALLTTSNLLTAWITTNCGKFFKRWEYQTTFPASSEICMQEEATVRTGHGKTDWFQIGKGVCQGCILSPCLFNLYTEYIMRNARLEEAQAGIKTAGRKINNLRYSDDTTLMAESKELLTSLLMKVKEESEEVGFKAQHSENEDHGIWPHHFMGNRWGNSGNSVRLYFSGLQNHCRW